MKESKGTSGGVTIGGLFQLALIVLKFCGVIEWSWLWVLAPTWGGLAAATLLFVIGMVFIVMSK